MSLPFLHLPVPAQQAWLRERLARPAPVSALNMSDGFRLPGREGATTAAAVLVPLVNRAEGLTVLLTQRSADLPDHPGQISFPGGRVEPTDPDLGYAALRETEEETGIAQSLTALGMAAYETVTGFRVTPVVGCRTAVSGSSGSGRGRRCLRGTLGVPARAREPAAAFPHAGRSSSGLLRHSLWRPLHLGGDRGDAVDTRPHAAWRLKRPRA